MTEAWRLGDGDRSVRTKIGVAGLAALVPGLVWVGSSPGLDAPFGASATAASGPSVCVPPPSHLGLDAYRHWDKLPYLELGDRSMSQSSADPGGTNKVVQTLPTYPDGEQVLADDSGPGVMSFMRMQSTSGSPWQLSLNGQHSATAGSSDLGQVSPSSSTAHAFPYPLSSNSSENQGSSVVAGAIPFSQGLTWTSSGAHGNFYSIERKLPYGTPLSTWSPSTPAGDVTNQLREAGSDVAPTNIPSKSGTLSLPAGTETTVAAVTGGPSEIRALELHVPAGEKVRTGNSRVRIYWDGESTPSVDAPLKFLAGDGAGVYQPQARPLVGGYLAGAGGDGSTFMDFNLYYPMPFHSSARVTLTSDPSASTLTGIGWSLRYQSFSDPAGWWGTFHTTYTSVPKPVAGQDMTFLDVAGSGRVVGTVVNFAQVGGTLEGDPRFYIDNSNTPQVQATGTEEWGLGGDYWNGIIPGSPPIITQGHQTTLALGGYPSGLNNPPGSDIDGAAEYRFMIADSVPFNDHLTFRFQHGGNDNSTNPYRAAVMWYLTPNQTAPLTDEVHVGDPASAAAHGYAAPGAQPATLTAAYGYAVTAPSSTDTGDSTTGATSFTMALNPANVGAFLRRKSDYGLPNQRANVFLDGQFAGTWYSSGSFSGTDANGVPRRWRDEEFPLPASLTEGKSSVHVQLQFGQTTTDKAWSNFDYQMYSFVPRGCTTSLPAGNVGSAYNASLAATGGTPPYAWSISTGALPAGLSLNGSSGAISGSPTGPPGTTSFTATVADRSTSPQSTPQPMSIAVSPTLPTNCTTYSSPATGSHQVCGAILAKYQSLGGPAGFLGNPTTDETGTPDGVGRFNHFSSTDNRSNIDGSIYWTAGTGAGSVHGAIRAKWASLGWERSCLGDPLSDEFAISGGRQSNFQRGVISYSFASARATASCG